MSGSTDPVLEAIGRLDERIHERFGRVQEQVSGVAEGLGRLEERVGGIDLRLGRLEDRVDRLRVDVMDRLDRQQNLLTTLRDDIGVNMAAMDRARTANKQTRDDLAQLTEQVSIIHRRLIRLEERVDRRENGA